MKEFVDNKYGQRKAQFFRDQVVSNSQAAMARMRAEAVNNPEVFLDTPMAAYGMVYNGMSNDDILSMYDKKQKAYSSMNPFFGMENTVKDVGKYFYDPKYFAHKQEFYINGDYAKGLSEDDITNAFTRKGIGENISKTVAYNYFNPQQSTDTTYSSMSPEDRKAMRKSERDNYKNMLNEQKDWFNSASYVGSYAPSYACGGIKKMAPGGPTVVYVDRFGNKYMSDGSVLNRSKNYYGQYVLLNTSSATSGDTTSTQPVSNTNPQTTQSQNTDVATQDDQTGTDDISNNQSAVEKIKTSNQVGDGRSFININTPWGHGKVYLDNNNIDVRRNGRRLAIWGDRNYRRYYNKPEVIDNSYIPKNAKEINIQDNTSDVYYNTKNYWGSTPTVSYDNLLGNMRCGGITKAALGVALIDDEKYDNGNMPNTPIGPVNPVSLEPMMTVDTTPSKEETDIPETENIKMRNDQADAATGIKNKNDYGYGISNAAWNGLMFAGNFAEKMRNNKNTLVSVAANLNNTQTPVTAMRGYDPTVNPTHLGYDADPSRLSVLRTYKCGGRKYAQGGIYDLTAKEIDEILKNGGKIEYIW